MKTGNKIKLSILIVLGIISNYIFFIEYYSLNELEKIFTYSIMIVMNSLMLCVILLQSEKNKIKKQLKEDENENITEVI